MAHQLSSTLEGGLLRVVIGGELDSKTVPAIIAQVWQWVQQPGVKALLVDTRNLQGRSSLSETYFNIRNYPTAGIRLRCAVLELPEYMDRANFHDTAAGNLGFSIKHFTDEALAVDWLNEVFA
ncbi:MAG TPA: hypothetical protein VJU83_13265 [Burkholderiales bacterium]|nr:hypothetical protein [Burkholderiales bacterium]